MDEGDCALCAREWMGTPQSVTNKITVIENNYIMCVGWSSLQAKHIKKTWKLQECSMSKSSL